MSAQPKALRLADELEMWTMGEPAAEELRRLHQANADLLKALQIIADSEEYQGETVVCDFKTLQSVARAAIVRATGDQS